jgi:hypothetical protein
MPPMSVGFRHGQDINLNAAVHISWHRNMR